MAARLLNKRSLLPVAWINPNNPSHLPVPLALSLRLVFLSISRALSLLSHKHTQTLFFLRFISVSHRFLWVSLAAAR